MCERYSLTVDPLQLRIFFGAEPGDVIFPPRYNAAPGQRLPVILSRSRRRVARLMTWGRERNGALEHDAPAEALDSEQRELLARGRCIVPVDGFFRWRDAGAQRVPYWFHLQSREPFSLAGLHDRSGCFVILTIPSAEAAGERMPAILPRGARSRWLAAEEEESASVLELLRPYSPRFVSERLRAHPVSHLVDSARNDVPECLEPVDERAPQLDLFGHPDGPSP
jgi:putative SOS response-associated peptidase YedK